MCGNARASAAGLRRYTRAELAAAHGRDGAEPILIAYEGRVYDVTASFPWRRGFHWACVFGGEDLTGMLDLAPHGPEMLERVPCVGWLSDDETGTDGELNHE